MPAAGAALVWRHKALASRTRPRSTAESWIWLDTPDKRLRDAGLALRAPSKGPRRVCPLMPAIGFRLPGEATGPQTELPAGAVPEAVEGAVLETVARYAGRHQWSRADATGVALRLQVGRIEGGTGGSAVAQLSLTGPRRAVVELAQNLAADLPLLPAHASLDELAQAQALGAAPRHRRRGPPDLGDTGNPAEALALALAHLTEVLLAQAPEARAEAGPAGVHQLRVAARRLRSCLKQFRRSFSGPALEALNSGLGDLARGLTDAREWDVFLGGLGAELGAALGQDQRWSRLLRQAEMQRLEAYGALRVLLEGPAFRHVVWQAVRLASLREWDASAGLNEAPLRPWAASLLQKRRKAMKKLARDIENATDESLHDLRLEAKKLRYAAELFAPLWPGRATRRFQKRLAFLQDALGLSNDAVVARARVASLKGAPAWAIGLAEGWSLAAAQDMRPRAIEAWHGFKKQDSFWSEDVSDRRMKPAVPFATET
ncbi:CHAD domain-containing protein [Pseudoroseomonas globiformis]|uniref:CHAD domain-containing protein n=1 Tax=Teichococcus globiformis TaxID=2307229 RepID=A0ABV7FZ90_9PROT